MTHQTVDSPVVLYGRPKRDTIIQKDDIVSLKIDCNLLSVDKFIDKYCSTDFSGNSSRNRLQEKQFSRKNES